MSRWEVLDGWEWVKARDIAEVIGGGTPPSKDPRNFSTEGVPWLTPSDLTGYRDAYIARGARDLSEQGLSKAGARILPKGTVLFTSRAPIGYCAIASQPLATNQGFKSLVLPDGISPEFLRHYLLASKDYAESLSSGTTFRELSTARMKELEIPLAPTAEQQRIVAKLQALQERSRRAREALSEVGPLLEQFRQSVLAAAFRGDLTAHWRATHTNVEPASELLNRIRAERRRRWEQAELAKYEAQSKKPPKKWKDRYKEPEPIDDTELSELPEGWGYTRIDALLSQTRPGIKTGPFGSLLKKHEHRQQGVPVLGIENIDRMRFVEGNKIYITEEKADYLSDYDVYPNDILISRSGTVGEVCVVPESVCTARFSTNIIRVVLAEDGMSPTFFGYVITGSPFVKRQISEACAGSTRDFLNKTILESLVFPLPPIAEQSMIVERLERLFNWTSTIVDVATDCMEALDHFDQAILTKAFRGELVPQNPTDEPASVLLERLRAQLKQQAESAKETAKSHQSSKPGENSSRLKPQQLTLAEVLRTADWPRAQD